MRVGAEVKGYSALPTGPHSFALSGVDIHRHQTAVAWCKGRTPQIAKWGICRVIGEYRKSRSDQALKGCNAIRLASALSGRSNAHPLPNRNRNPRL